MEYTIILIFLSISICFYFLITQSGRRKSGVTTRLPPGPYPLPIIGNIFKLGDKPHHSLAALSKTYGPLMSLKLGTTTTIVVSSREIAQEFFSKHDASFADRSLLHVVTATDHYKYSIAWLPVGDRWRMLRKISKENLFVVHQLDASELVRKKKVQQLLDYVQDYSDSGKPVDIGEIAATTTLNVLGKPVDIGQIAATTTLNVLSNFIFSIDLAQYDSKSSQDFTDIVWSLMEISGRPNVADFFPILRPLDPQGLLRKTRIYTQKLLAIFEEYISKRLQERTTSSSDASSSKDLMDLLLDMSQNEKPSITLVGVRYLLFNSFESVVKCV
ncbi:hypothetical protein L6452_20299 [Arctium lappa]|uniref:Uncharacterized protein n=1 Tax=Arctium lappa TaxID=4217 RepID=A0ACB9BAG5_ARCLA|nr:hypothetical protein L6452_20299 [Arctium lappa]